MQDKFQAFFKPNVHLIRRGEICQVKCKLTSFSFEENHCHSARRLVVALF